MPSLYPHRAVLPTPLGVALEIHASADCIGGARFVRSTSLTGRTPVPVLREAARQLRAYFKKRLERFELPLDLHGTEFQCAVWRFVAQLGAGELVSYGDLARCIGYPRAARGVARAMAQTPIDLFVPSHRVIGADGSVRGAGRGSMRRRLLNFEGITLR
jgi:O-6-methylguanine DNA methyltransferase